MTDIDEAQAALRRIAFNAKFGRFNRANVVGDGPNRKLLPSFRRLGTMPDDLLALARAEVATAATSDDCDCGTDAYKVSQDNPLIAHFGEAYRQKLLQQAMTDGLTERDYTHATSPVIARLINLYPHLGFFRARIAKLPPGAAADWHTDTNTSVYCRLQFMVQGRSTWHLKRAGKIETQTMLAGDIWFANAGYAHKVVNDGDEDRWVMILNADHAGIAASFGSLLAEAPR